MPFPTTNVLDTFSGTLSNWHATGGVFGGSSVTFTLDTGRVRSSGTSYDGSYWTTSTFGPDKEVFVTIATPITNAGFELGFGVQPGTGTFDGFSIFGHDSGNGFAIYRYDNGNLFQVTGSPFTQAIAAGDSLGLQRIGSNLTAWYKASAGSWTSLVTVTDANYNNQSGAVLFLEVSNSGAFYDNFGGGTYVPPPPPAANAPWISAF